ncbi:MAG: DUF72 domain-containing protein [Caulobacterales bacterium]
MPERGAIRAGVGGWTFEPWRGVFYPAGLRQKDELNFASRALTTIEINGTYHSLQKPESFAKWAADTPDGFVFAVKASRYATNRKVLAEGGEAITRFLNQGLTELGARLGPVLWQFMPFKRFDPADFGGFLDLLPDELGGLPLRHVMEVRHPSFADPAFIEMCRSHKIAICLADHAKYPLIPDITADFVYARLMQGSDDIETAYPPADLDLWANRLKTYAQGSLPDGFAPIDPAHAPSPGPHEVFAYVIHEGKVRAPAAAMALIERFGV